MVEGKGWEPKENAKKEEITKDYIFEEKLIVLELIKDASPAIREALRMQIRMISRKILKPKLIPEEINQMEVSKFYELAAKFTEKYNIKSEWDFLGKK